MKKLLSIGISLILVTALFFGVSNQTKKPINKVERKEINATQAGEKKTPEERALFSEARELHEYYMQVNPLTGEIPRGEKLLEFENAKSSQTTQSRNSRAVETSYISRGPSNLGGRTRKVAQDVTDVTGNTMLGCGVSGGVFRTTDGGASWIKVSANDEIHNATAIVQDTRSGFENIWYYGTGEGSGNSASPSQSSAATIYWGNGIWKSTDSGLTWTQIPSTASTQELWNSRFDTVWALAVHPITGDLYAAINGRVSRFNGTIWETEVTNPGTGLGFTNYTDVAIASSGRVYAAFSGNQDSTIEGIWTSADGDTSWSRISAASFTPTGRVVLALAPSNQDKLYTLFINGNAASCTGPVHEVDLWMWNQNTTTWADYSGKLPNETPCNSGTASNVPFSVFSGYCMDINVKPDDENFVVFAGTNAYKMEDITLVGNFTRIGGYNIPSLVNYSIYDVGGTPHHPDVHDLIFDIADPDIIFSGTDGGIHEADVTEVSVAWTNLNNNYQTYQFYHVGIDPLDGSDLLVGGAQDNGTNYGGTTAGLADLTSHKPIWGGDGVAAEISRDEASVPTFLGSQNGNFWRVKNYLDASSANDIENFIAPFGSTSSFVTYFYLDPDHNNTLYYAGQNRLYRTTDASNTSTAINASNWTNLGTSANIDPTHTDYFKTFSTTRGAYNASTSYLLMGGDEGHIYRLDDPQNVLGITSAVDITPTTATIGFPSIVTGLAIHPTNRDIVLATYANYGTESIYLSTNASTATPTWTLVERNLSAHSIRSAVITEVGGETLYFVGTARGLYSTTDPSSVDWSREAPTQLGYAIISSLRYRTSDNKLLIGTHGNGVYEATITSTLGIDDIDDISSQIKLYPNPAKNDISIEITNKNDEFSYQISNLLGQRISKGTINERPIDVSSLQSGIYLIEIESNSKKGVKRFIKQ